MNSDASHVTGSLEMLRIEKPRRRIGGPAVDTLTSLKLIMTAVFTGSGAWLAAALAPPAGALVDSFLEQPAVTISRTPQPMAMTERRISAIPSRALARSRGRNHHASRSLARFPGGPQGGRCGKSSEPAETTRRQ